MRDLRFKLNTGAEIPALGLGTWQSGPGEVQTAVEYAISIGYRHIDCAWGYANESEVGEGIAQALSKGVKRKDLFVTTKLWCTHHSRVEDALDESLKGLQLDYVDLYLMHWPIAMNPHGNDTRFPRLPNGSIDVVRDWSHIQTWELMERLVTSGKVRAIGVCNYSVKFLKELLAHAKVIPAVNQIENHPALPQEDVVSFCKSKGIHITAYSPLGSMGSPLIKEDVVANMAKYLNISPACLLLSYHVVRGSSVLAKSTTPTRIKANADLAQLSAGVMKRFDEYSAGLAKAGRLTRFVKRDYGIDIGFPDMQ